MSRELIINTYSIVGFDPMTGDLGVACASRFPAVGAQVPMARANVGAVANQSWWNASHSPVALNLLAKKVPPKEVLTRILRDDPKEAYRQIAIIDLKGRIAAHTGRYCQDWAGHRIGKYCSAQGNVLTGHRVVDAMVETFETEQGDLLDRLVSALQAGEDAGGDMRGKQAAAVLVVRKEGGFRREDDKYADLRVDDNPEPVRELCRLVNVLDRDILHRLGSRDLGLPKGHDVEEVQRMLQKLGYYKGCVDGVFGNKLDLAVRTFERANHLWETGSINKPLLQLLVRKADRPRKTK
jgi:uncharacterized Ntn-hydrolase superfamily protein